jgi:hypothetical protein
MMPNEQTGAVGLRLDTLLVRLAEGVVRQAVEPRVKVPLWDAGLNEVVGQFVSQCGVPSRPVTMVDVATRLGILKGVR